MHVFSVRPMVQAIMCEMRGISMEIKEKQWLMIGANYKPVSEL